MAILELMIVVLTVTQGILGSVVLQRDSEPTDSETCVMSFVIPKNKVKTSCQMEERVNRRMNLLESKLNSYRQEVNQLQLQLQKERQLCQNKVFTLEEKMSSLDSREKYNNLAEKVEGLEVVFKRGGGDVLEREKKYTGSWQNNKAKVGHKNSLERENLESIVKPIVISEIEKYLENFTVIAEKKRALEDNVIMDNWLRNDQSYIEKSDQNATRSQTEEMMKELEEIKNKLNETGDQVATRVGSILKNVTINGDIVKLGNMTRLNSSSDHDVAVEETAQPVVDVSMNENEKHLGRNALEGEHEPQQDQEQDSNTLSSNLYTDELEELLRGEINMLLQARMEEVISLMRKQSANLNSAVHKNSKDIDKIEDDNEEKMKRLQDKIDGTRLEVSSLSSTVQEFYKKLENMPTMKETMEEIKKNVTLFSRQRNQDVVVKIDEHEKRLRTLHRLYDIFKGSLQHYRNESKVAYDEINTKIVGLELNLAREIASDLYINVTSKLGREIERYNTSLSRRNQAMTADIRNLEDNYVLFRMDLKNLERRHRSKTEKLEQDNEQINKRFNRILNQHRKLQDNVNNLKNDQQTLKSSLNQTSATLHSLRSAFNLNVSDTWIEHNFDYDTSRTECFGKQYIRYTKFTTGRIAGVVLCDNMRYKIFLGNTIEDKFLNVGDVHGLGEDHCEFVGATVSSIIKLSPLAVSMKTEEGYARDNWGQEPRKVRLNFLRPSPAWYECGIHIP